MIFGPVEAMLYRNSHLKRLQAQLQKLSAVVQLSLQALNISDYELRKLKPPFLALAHEASMPRQEGVQFFQGSQTILTCSHQGGALSL